MKIFLNKNTHVGIDEPADKTKTWLPQNLTEEANFLSNPATYGVLSGPRVKIAEGLDAQNIDAYGEKFRVYEVEPSTLVVKEYKNGAWVDMELNLDVPEGLITFTIDGTEYQAEEGMTWEQWIASEYNTNGYTTTSGNLIISLGGAAVVNSSYETVQASYEIISGSAYKLSQGGGA